jgi:Prion-inhibition and propagation
MVPVEPISLTIGIASLFSTCIEGFDYFKAAQSLAGDLKILLVKLDIEKTCLLIWGNAVGIKVDDSERVPDLRNPAKVEVITKCLERIKALFSDTEKLEKEYGLKAATPDEGGRDSGVDPLSQNSMNVFKTSYKRF